MLEENEESVFKLTGRQFILILASSQLLPPKVIDNLLSDFSRHYSRHGNDITATVFANWLVSEKALTRWQADKLLNGQYRGFFHAQYKLLDCLEHVADGTNYAVMDTLTNERCVLHVRPPSLSPDHRPKYTITCSMSQS